MSTATWPITLPGKLRLEGLSDTLGDNLVRTQMETGPAKTRRRSTAAPDDIGGTLVLTTAQTETLDEFYRHTLAGGSLPFWMTHPRTESLARFKFKAPPAYSSALGLWIARLSLEKLP